jgi:hypothetical protein
VLSGVAATADPRRCHYFKPDFFNGIPKPEAADFKTGFRSAPRAAIRVIEIRPSCSITVPLSSITGDPLKWRS